jgi:hypothetical protein
MTDDLIGLNWLRIRALFGSVKDVVGGSADVFDVLDDVVDVIHND